MESIRPLIVTRIRDSVPELETVRGTANIQAVLRQAWTPPACFVWRSAVRAVPETENLAVVEQTVQSRYSVLIALNTKSDDGTVEDTAESLSDAVMNCLLGWRPNDNNPLLYAGGEALYQLERNLLLWKDIYSLTEYFYTPI